MKIYLERSGGFAGMRLTASVDTEVLDKDKADNLQNIVEKSLFFDLPSKTIQPKMGADYFKYKITIEAEGKAHTVEVTDMEIPPMLKPLIDILVDTAREQ